MPFSFCYLCCAAADTTPPPGEAPLCQGCILAELTRLGDEDKTDPGIGDSLTLGELWEGEDVYVTPYRRDVSDC